MCIPYIKAALYEIEISPFWVTYTYQESVWPWRCVGWYGTVFRSCLVANIYVNCIVQDSLYHNMDIGTMWHCAFVSCTTPQTRGLFIPPPNVVSRGRGDGVYWNHLVRLYVCLSVRLWNCCGISIWNFICMLLVAMGRSLLIFSSDVTFKMAAWSPSWTFRFPDSNFSLALDIKLKL